MLRYRSFRNTDPPALVEIWRSRNGQPGLLQPMSVDLFEQFVLGRLYFDREGLQLAWDGDRPVGFAHAGFGPDETEDHVVTDLGTTCLILTRPDCDEAEVAAGLLARSEDYLRRRGAKVLYGGGIKPLDAFYLGLYGGSELPGVLASDTLLCQLFLSRGYKEIDRTVGFHGDLPTFEAPVTRQQTQIRRRMRVHVTHDPPARSWWDACTTGSFQLTRYEIVSQQGGPSVAFALVRNIELSTGLGGGQSVGLLELFVAPQHRRQGLVTFLLTEVFHQLSREGVIGVEVRTMQHNAAGVRLYRKLGFQEVNQGIVFRKDGDGVVGGR
jgi:ribosomal protein S18 acetylase RimI-like enzyme